MSVCGFKEHVRSAVTGQHDVGTVARDEESFSPLLPMRSDSLGVSLFLVRLSSMRTGAMLPSSLYLV